MKLNKILSLGAALTCGLTLASCDKTQEVSVGLGYSASYSNGTFTVNAAMVAFDDAGKVVDARIDVIQYKVAINDAGTGVDCTVTTLLDGNVKTKLELGKDYNMLGSSDIGAEVDAQIEFFADWSKGQTVEEIESKIDPTKGHGTAHHTELEGECTITCTEFVAAMKDAYASKTTDTYKVGEFATGVAMVAKNVVSESYGAHEITVDLGGVIVEDGKVVAAQMDAIVCQLSIVDGNLVETAGSKYVVNGAYTSKKDLGSAYGMEGAVDNNKDGIMLEWDAQAAVIEAAAEGKTGAEITALVKAEGELATATINLDTYLKAFAKAADYATKEHVGPQA